MTEANEPKEVRSDRYTKQFLRSPVYVMVMSDTLKTAARSYVCARWLSVILFGVGIVLIGLAVISGIIRKEETWSLVFGGLGTANVIALLLYRPIERIQSGVDALIKSQIACLSFQVQHDSIARALSEMPTNTESYDALLQMNKYLRDSTTQLITDLGGQASTVSGAKPNDQGS